MYSMGATHQNMKASLMRVKVGERLSWSMNSSDRNTIVRTNQYLRYKGVIVMGVMVSSCHGVMGVMVSLLI